MSSASQAKPRIRLDKKEAKKGDPVVTMKTDGGTQVLHNASELKKG